MLRTIRMVPAFVLVALALALWSWPRDAFAQRELLSPMGARKTLAIDQLAGFRASAVSGFNGASGFSYAGPIGFAHQSYTEARFNGTGDDTIHTNTFWVAPSADFFVIDHLSIGGLIELSTTWGSQERQRNGTNTTDSFSLPTTTSITFLPRIGYLIDISDRFGIWPRGGIGYASRQYAVTEAFNNPTKASAYGFLLDLDVGFLYRPVEAIFFHLGPEVAFSLGASHSSTTGGVTTTANASFFQISVLGGVGVFLDL